MNVKELIAILGILPQDLKIVDECNEEIKNVTLVKSFFGDREELVRLETFLIEGDN